MNGATSQVRNTFLLRLLPVVAAPFLLLGIVGLSRSRLEAPEPTVLVRDRNGAFLFKSDGEALGYWPVAPIPPRVAAATAAIEDRRFGRHPGVDPVAVLRAIRQNLAAGRRISGASTLAMQVARLQHPGPRTMFRKIGEAAAALAMTLRNGRPAVMAQYLRIAPYGNRIHGIGYAARKYLDKPVEDLSWAEIAFLSALPQAPSRMNPYRYEGRRRAISRGQRILTLLRDRGTLTTAEYELAADQLRGVRPPLRDERPATALHAIVRLERTIYQAHGHEPLRQPLVRAWLDLKLQKETSWMLLSKIDELAGRGVGNGAAVVIERDGNKVIAYVGSSDYLDVSRAGAIDFAASPRSAGSTLKPFIYALALDNGVISAATMLEDMRRGAGGISNADERYLGP
ncbi:transglycosylase domain-containing protein, partial [bacterium]|nr:transglycosylase domain-containing protein [candidate division CSSED10-310 bacterium]